MAGSRPDGGLAIASLQSPDHVVTVGPLTADDAGSPTGVLDGHPDAVVSRFAADLRAQLTAQPPADALADAVRRVALPRLGDFCIVDLADPGMGVRRLVATVLPASAEVRLRARVESSAPALDLGHARLHAGPPVLITTVETVDQPPGVGPPPPLAAIARAIAALGGTSGLVVPMHVPGATPGVMTFGTTSGSRRLDAADAALAHALAIQAGYALETARLAHELERAREGRRRVEQRLREHEAALRQSEAELQGFFDAPASLLTILDVDDDARDVVIRRPSAAVAAMVGATVPALTGRSVRALGADEARVAALYTQLRRCRDTGTPVAFDLDVRVRAGDERWSILPLRCVASRIGDDPGRASVAAMAFDLTALRQREAELAGFFEAPGVLMAIVTADDARRDIVIRAANSTFAEFHGHMHDGVIDRTGREIGISDTKVAQLYAQFRQCRESGAPMVFEIETDTPPGHLMLASLRRIGSDPRHSPVAGVFTDMSALRESQARLAGFFEAPGAPMAILDLDGATCDARFLRTNVAFAALWGASPESLEGRTLRSLADDEAVMTEQCAMLDRCRQSGEPVVREIRMPRQGDERTFLITLRRIAADARHSTIALTALETTSQNRLRTELLQAQKMEAVGHLAGGVAHDFNNVLTVISGATEALLAGRGSERERQMELLDIRRAVDRAAELTRQLLAFSRRQSTEPLPIGVNDVVREMHPMLRRLLHSDIIVELDLDDRLPPVLADAGQLGQVLLNLVLNARDALPEGGRIRIATRCRAGAALAADARAGGPRVAPSSDATLHPACSTSSDPPTATSYAVLTVADTGVGMPAEVCARIFEPFFSTKGPERGSGLGLPTVSTIIRRAGGCVWVESAPHAGTTFSVALPALLSHSEPDEAIAATGDADGASVAGSSAIPDAPESAAPGHDALPADHRAFPGRARDAGPPSRPLPERRPVELAAPLAPGGLETVLLVEGDAAVRLFATRALRTKGYRVLQAASREEALAVASSRGGEIHVLAYDLDLPDATDAAADLERSLVGSGKDVARVHIAGSVRSPTVGDRRGPAAQRVAKPFTAEALATAIRSALDAAASRAADLGVDHAPHSARTEAR